MSNLSREQKRDKVIEAITLAGRSELYATARDQYDNSQPMLAFLYGGIRALDKYIQRMDKVFGEGSAFDSENGKEYHFFSEIHGKTQVEKIYQLYMLENDKRFPSERSVEYYRAKSAVHATMEW